VDPSAQRDQSSIVTDPSLFLISILSRLPDRAAGAVLRPDPIKPEGSAHRAVTLASRGAHHHALGMFVITEADADAIRAVFNQEGELSAAIELRRRFPGVTDNAKARACARSIAGWAPLPVQLRPVTRLRPGKDN
jgi:hypothetical protein